VRDSDNSIIQFQYGEDSLSVEKTPFLNEKQFPFLIDNYQILTSNKDELIKIRKICHHEVIDKKIKKTKDWKKSNQPEKNNELNLNDGVGERWSPFLNFSKLMSADESLKTKNYEEKIKLIIEKWKSMSEEDKKVYKKGKFKRRLPITASHNPDRHLGAISEKLQDTIDKYIEKNHEKFTDDSKYSSITSLSYNLEKENFKELIYLKSLKSCITPGDSVGILAAQSIGEPSTQMTLNTFHFAGRGDMNVTLGIPRLREILMVASANIKTPSMQVPVFDNKLSKAEKLKENWQRVNLENCIHRINIEQKLNFENKTENSRIWLTKVRVEFLPQIEMRNRTNTSLKSFELFSYVENKFIKNLCISINKKYNQMSSSSLLHASTVRDKSLKNFKNINTETNENDDEDNVDKDMAAEVLDSGEAYGEKILNKVDDELEYVGEDEEERQLNQNENEISDDDNEEIENENNEDENDVKPNLDDIQILKKKTKKIDASRIDRILNTSDMIQSYSYDGENMQWFEITFKVNKKYY
jgi:DNA-directed RNA polymerase I subunit RPA1